MDRNVEIFSGDVSSIQILVVDFLGDESVCENEKCKCGMDLPWGVIAEVGTDEYDIREFDEDIEETESQVIARSTSVEAALLSARKFELENEQKWSVVLTDAAHYTFRLEAAFKEGVKTGNINWEDIIFEEDSDDKSDEKNS